MAELTPEEEDRQEQLVNPRPKPDGNTPEGAGHQISYFEKGLPAARGFSGRSRFASRADHRHPLCINPLQKPMRIGKLPRGIAYDFTGAKNFGTYGNVGYPSKTALDVSNTYALGNHCHAYGFIDSFSISSVGGTTKGWQGVPDGAEVSGSVWTQEENGLTVQNDTGAKKEFGYTDNWAKGFAGVSPFPSHSDHSHPLNVADLLCRGQTGGDWGGSGSAADTIKGIGQTGGATGYEGCLPFYARVDHVHPYKFLSTTGADATNGDFCMGVDGCTMTNASGNYKDWTIRLQKGADTEVSKAKGSVGVLPFPARLDHTHPLNVFDENLTENASTSLVTFVRPFGQTGATGNYTAYISCGVATGATGYATTASDSLKRCLGISRYYARVDHSHPIPVDTGSVTSSSEVSGKGVVTIANISSNCVLPTEISSQRDNKEGNTLRYAKSALFNLQTYPRTFSVNCCTRVVTFGTDNYFFFRNFTYNKWGLLQSVGGENSYCKCSI